MRFEHGKSYVWVFVVFFVLWLGLILIAGAFQLSFRSIKPFLFLLPSMLLFVLVLELRSKVALDSWWVARHPAGTRMYSIMIVWHVVGLVLLSLFVLVGILAM